MSTILDSVRGTVQGVLSGVGHVLWYVDWQTGGRTAREVLPIAAIDEIELPAAPGPLTQDARERLMRRIERELGALA